MPKSAVILTLEQHRAAMAEMEIATVEDMARRWLAMEQTMEANITALYERIAAKQAAGETVSLGMIYREERYQILAAQMQEEIHRWNSDYAVTRIAQAQTDAATLGINAAQEAIVSSSPSFLSRQFNRINIGAVENMIGYAGDGSPLNELLTKDYGEAAHGLLDALITASAKGEGARRAAGDMLDSLDIGLDRALLIARTEINRSYRQASTEQYRQSGVVSGFMRLAARDEACLACILLDGERLDSEDELDDHPNGRCTVVPIIDGMDPPEWETGSEWLEGLPESRQREIMGDTRFEMWQNGMELSAFATKTHSDEWGDSPAITSIKDLENIEPSTPVQLSLPDALAEFESSIVGQDYESAGVYDKAGNLLFSKDGISNRVSFTEEELQQMSGAVVTHNHPGGSPFSFDDLSLFANRNLAEIRAVGNQYTYILQNVEGAKISKEEMGKLYDEALYQAARKHYKEDLSENEMLHRALEELAGLSNLNYERRVTNE